MGILDIKNFSESITQIESIRDAKQIPIKTDLKKIELTI